MLSALPIPSFKNKRSLIIQEVHRLQKEADEANKSSSVLTRDNQRLEVQLADTAHQVRIIRVHLGFYSQQF